MSTEPTPAPHHPESSTNQQQISTPLVGAQSAVDLLWETDIEVIGICKFPCVRSKNGGGVILTGSPALEVQQLAALHNEAIESLRAQLAERCDRAEERAVIWKVNHDRVVNLAVAAGADLRDQLAQAQAMIGVFKI